MKLTHIPSELNTVGQNFVSLAAWVGGVVVATISIDRDSKTISYYMKDGASNYACRTVGEFVSRLSREIKGWGQKTPKVIRVDTEEFELDGCSGT